MIKGEKTMSKPWYSRKWWVSENVFILLNNSRLKSTSKWNFSIENYQISAPHDQTVGQNKIVWKCMHCTHTHNFIVDLYYWYQNSCQWRKGLFEVISTSIFNHFAPQRNQFTHFHFKYVCASIFRLLNFGMVWCPCMHVSMHACMCVCARV